MPELKHSTFGTVGTTASKEPENKMNLSDLQSLIELGCIRDQVEIGGKIFSMRSLNAMERLELAKFLGEEPTAERLFSFNTKLLAVSIETVNGIPFENFHTNSELDPISRKQELLSVMQSPVLGRLLEFYNTITERCDAQFNLEEAKN